MNTKNIKCSQPNIKDLPEPIKETSDETTKASAINDRVQRESVEVVVAGPPVVLRCEQWEDFQNYAFQPKTVSFMRRESDGLFEADALTKNQIVAYIGKTPKIEPLLKIWLSKHLEVSEEKIFEGFVSKA